MQTQLEKDVAALSAIGNATVNSIIAASPVLNAALTGANLAATRDAQVSYPKEVRSTGGQTTGWV
jgi:hypothetical protein